MNREISVKNGRIIAVRQSYPSWQTGYRGPGWRSLPVDAFVEVAQDTRGDAPDITILVRHGIILSGDALPIAAATLVVFRSHQEGERTLERLRYLGLVEIQGVSGRDPRQRRQDAEPAEGQIEIEIAERLDQRRRQTDLLLGLAQRGTDRAYVMGIDLAAGKRDLAGVAREIRGPPRPGHRCGWAGEHPGPHWRGPVA